MSLKASLPQRELGRRWATFVLLVGSLVGATGYTSCASSTGPLTGPALEIVPGEILLRASRVSPAAVGRATVEGGESGDRILPTIQYFTGGFAEWLTVEVRGRDLTLRAVTDALDPGSYSAVMSITGESAGGHATLRVNLDVVE